MVFSHLYITCFPHHYCVVLCHNLWLKRDCWESWDLCSLPLSSFASLERQWFYIWLLSCFVLVYVCCSISKLCLCGILYSFFYFNVTCNLNFKNQNEKEKNVKPPVRFLLFYLHGGPVDRRLFLCLSFSFLLWQWHLWFLWIGLSTSLNFCLWPDCWVFSYVCKAKFYLIKPQGL